jgi:hypothetical protein
MARRSRQERKAARKVRQTTRRAKYGGKTFFGRMIKAGTGIAGGLLTGNVGGALQSLLTSQKVDADGSQTAAQIQQNAQAVQAATENAPVQAMRNEAQLVQAQQAAVNSQNDAAAAEPTQGNNSNGTPKKNEQNKMFKMVAIGVVVLLSLVIVAKVLTPKTATK